MDVGPQTDTERQLEWSLEYTLDVWQYWLGMYIIQRKVTLTRKTVALSWSVISSTNASTKLWSMADLHETVIELLTTPHSSTIIMGMPGATKSSSIKTINKQMSYSINRGKSDIRVDGEKRHVRAIKALLTIKAYIQWVSFKMQNPHRYSPIYNNVLNLFVEETIRSGKTVRHTNTFGLRPLFAIERATSSISISSRFV